MESVFPISRDPPEGGTEPTTGTMHNNSGSFQFLGIPPKGEQEQILRSSRCEFIRFQFLGIPPKGEHHTYTRSELRGRRFQFLGIPPKGELIIWIPLMPELSGCFQFLGIPPKGEQSQKGRHCDG